MIRWLSAFLFGCFHQRTTFPLTMNGETHVTCLECGKEIRYDWREMRVAK